MIDIIVMIILAILIFTLIGYKSARSLDLADKIKIRRKTLGLSRGDLSEKARIWLFYIVAIEERRIMNPRSEVLGRLATALDCDFDYLAETVDLTNPTTQTLPFPSFRLGDFRYEKRKDKKETV